MRSALKVRWKHIAAFGRRAGRPATSKSTGTRRPSRVSATISFNCSSTYSGDDARLNIGPKGFSGEKYGGATYWDTEGFCFPLYMAVAGEHVAKQLLLYRYMQLVGAQTNARNLAGASGRAVPDGDVYGRGMPQRVGDHL